MSDLVQMISKHYEAVSIFKINDFLKDVCYANQPIKTEAIKFTHRNRVKMHLRR